MSSIVIDWSDLGKVAVASAVFGIGIVAVFTAGVLGMSKAEGAGDGSSGRTAGLAVAGVCFAVCAAAVLYGLYLLIPQFH